jgi:hypothetical protein
MGGDFNEIPSPIGRNSAGIITTRLQDTKKKRHIKNTPTASRILHVHLTRSHHLHLLTLHFMTWKWQNQLGEYLPYFWLSFTGKENPSGGSSSCAKFKI